MTLLLEEDLATLSSIFAGRIPWAEEPGKLQSMGSQRVRCGCRNWACTHSNHFDAHLTLTKYFKSAICLVVQSCLTLCDLLDCSPPGSSVHRIFQARILEWLAISNSSRSSWLREQTCLFYLLHWQAVSLKLCHLESSSHSLRTCKQNFQNWWYILIMYNLYVFACFLFFPFLVNGIFIAVIFLHLRWKRFAKVC